MSVQDVTWFTTCWLAEEQCYRENATCSLAFQLTVTLKFAPGNFLYSLDLFPPQQSNLQMKFPPFLPALALACQYFLLVAIRSLPRLSYLRINAKHLLL